MRNVRMTINPVAVMALVFCIISFNSCSKEGQSLCRTCIATYISNNQEAAKIEACSSDQEKAFQEKWSNALIRVSCR